MVISSKHFVGSPSDMGADTAWRELYPSLRLISRRLVYSFRIPSWYGQEDEIIEDILQETARRIIERCQKSERGDAAPIYMLERMAVVIASNYCKDMRRKDKRFVCVVASDYSLKGYDVTNDQEHIDMTDVASEHVYLEGLFTLLAQEIAKFPDKQRNVLLTDLANRMCFEAQPTPLQKAFLNVSIRLQDYQQSLPEDPKERSRSAALLLHAYKRISQLSNLQKYTSVA